MEVVQKIVEDPELLINTVPGRSKILLGEKKRIDRGGGAGGGIGDGDMADDGSYCC
jgi:hypothetical protein